MAELDPLAVLNTFYPCDSSFRRLLLKHSMQVRDKALAILADAGVSEIDPRQVAAGAILHDVGIGQCDAPGILCVGLAPYIAHGILGGTLLRAYGRQHGIDLEVYARICERHTGSGLTADEIRRQRLPLPHRDFLPETPTEKLICLADKFYSKSGDMREHDLPRIRLGMRKFGPEAAARFDALCRDFGLPVR